MWIDVVNIHRGLCGASADVVTTVGEEEKKRGSSVRGASIWASVTTGRVGTSALGKRRFRGNPIQASDALRCLCKHSGNGTRNQNLRN